MVISMRVIINLVKRNVFLFVRDRGAVFFSILSMLIVLGLMILFLGNMNSENILEVLERFGENRDVESDKANVEYLIEMWTLAGILVTNAVTVTMTVMGNMIEDEEENRLASFYTAPVGRGQIALGYVLSAWLIGILMCLITLSAGQIFMAVSGKELLSVAAWLKLTGMIVLNTFVYAALAYLIALFIHSGSAWSGLLTVVGTLVGFAGAIYLPMAMLPKKVADVLRCLPVLHGAAMMRVVCTEEAIETTFAGLPKEVTAAFCENMGITVVMNEETVSFGAQAGYLAVLSIAIITAAVFISRKKTIRDR